MATSARLTPLQLMTALRVDRAAAVVTKADDAVLSAAGFGKSLPAGDDGSDPWARYVAAGIDLSDYRPLE